MNSELESIFVFGASGHAKVVIDIIEKEGRYKIAFLADDNINLKGTDVYGYRVIGGKTELRAPGIRRGIVAIGSNKARCDVAAWLIHNGYELVTAIHPSAQIARNVVIGNNTVVMAGAAINSDSRIGCSVVINTGASIDHDCSVGSGVHIAPGATLCGTVAVGDGTFICAGCTIIPNLNIGANVVVGAGSTVIRDVPNEVLVVGSPATIIKQISV